LYFLPKHQRKKTGPHRERHVASKKQGKYQRRKRWPVTLPSQNGKKKRENLSSNASSSEFPVVQKRREGGKKKGEKSFTITKLQEKKGPPVNSSRLSHAL